MNEMEPEPALRSRPKSDAKVENEKAVPMTKNTRQNTAATTTDPEPVSNAPGCRLANARPACKTFLRIGTTQRSRVARCVSDPACFVLINTSSQEGTHRKDRCLNLLSTVGGSVALGERRSGDRLVRRITDPGDYSPMNSVSSASPCFAMPTFLPRLAA